MIQFQNQRVLVATRRFSIQLLWMLLITLTISQLQAAELLTYSGQMVGDKGDPVITTKRFTLAAVRDVTADGGTLHWIIVEDGRGAIPWPHSYGSSQWLDGNGLNVQAATA